MRFLLCSLLFFSSLNGLVLEEIDSLESILQNKKVGYFVGSFDPFHKAHEAIVESSLNLCDYIIVHPVWGGDIYKVRSSVDIRLDMLFALYQNHPKVIVTRLTPKALQNALTVPGKPRRTPAFTGTHFIGIVGSDTALYLAPNPETPLVYMTGLEIAAEYAEHTWGSCMALPVESFIIALRAGDNIAALGDAIDIRPIITFIDIQDVCTLSSTALKTALRKNEEINQIVSPPIREIIERFNLYK